MSYAIAIDGPSGAGKSTIAKRVAKELSFIYVDTGAMYRAMALYVLEQNIDPQDQAKVAAACPDIDVTILYEDGVQQVLLNGKNVSTEIRQEIVGNTASKISVIKDVREKLVALQRQLAAKENVVMDGRDIGTQVLPDATVKIYLTASSTERAKRRYLELQEKGMPGELDQIEADIIERDNRDMNREISPLRQAEDAVLVDASFMGIEEVTAAVIAEFEKKTHAMEEAGEQLTAESLCRVYYELNWKYFGNEITVDEKIAMEWARIPHFYTPFYVYQYATGFSAAIALAGRILKEGTPAVEDYKKFLQGGSSAYPIELLRMAGVDMESAKPVREALRVFGDYLDELETLMA